jgi:hypothetical protein
MHIAITRQIARKLRRQRAFSKLTKRSSSNADETSDDANVKDKDVKI